MASLPRIGETISGFTVTELGTIHMLGARTVLFNHELSGAQLLYIQNDDRELGFNLITRGRNIRKVILTEKGHAFYRLAPELLRLLNAIADIRAGIKQPGKSFPPGKIISSAQGNTGRF